MRALAAVLILTSAPLIAGCLMDAAPTSERAATRVPLRAVAHGNDSEAEERRYLVVETRAEWEALWQTTARRSYSRENGVAVVHQAPVPDVDFQRERVLVAFMGTMPTNGYEVNVEAAWRDLRTGHVVAEIALIADPPQGGALPAKTSPYEAVAIPRGGPVTFLEIAEQTPGPAVEDADERRPARGGRAEWALD